MEVKKNASVSVVLHYSDLMPYDKDRFSKILNSIINQTIPPKELIILMDSKHNPEFEISSVKTIIIENKFANTAQFLNAAIAKSRADFILYLDNQAAEITLKRSYIETALICSERNPEMGILYADYDLIGEAGAKEIHLLKHHAGRLRDNQDYGKVFFFPKAALDAIGGFDAKVKYNHLYDVRLRLSGKFQLVHIANRYAGSLYSVVAQGKGHNVFDYLLAGKDVQLEAEAVVTDHLRSIGAYLKPGAFMHERPAVKEAQYVASVIIPVNNRPEFIESALGSVFRQTEQNIEAIVVVNGGDSDPTIQEVRKYMPGGSSYDEHYPAVKLVVTDVNNIGLSLNLGVKVAQSKYYVQLDSDDRLKPDAVEKAAAMFASDDRIGIVIGSYEVWEKKVSGEFIRMAEIPVVTHAEWTESNGRNNLLRINGAGAPRCIPIEVIKEMGWFGINDEPYARNYGEDYDLVMKISEKYRVGRIFDPIYEVVRHSGGTDHSIDPATIDRNDEAKDYMRLLAIQRRITLNQSK